MSPLAESATSGEWVLTPPIPSPEGNSPWGSWWALGLCGGGVIGLYLTSLHSYLLFHTLAEMFSVVVAFSVFVIAWNSRHYVTNGYLAFIGSAYLALGILDLMHTLGYAGMPIFPGYPFVANQLWIAARYLESLSLLVAFAFLGAERRPDQRLVLAGFVVATSLILAAIFFWRVFPVCFVAGQGQTRFKILSEYVIIAILAVDAGLLVHNRAQFNRSIYIPLLAATLLAILTEAAFTLYVSNYGPSNLVGHYLKVFSYACIYLAIVKNGVERPYTLIFRELAKANQRLTSEVAAHQATATERERVEAALRESEAQVRTKLNAILLPECDLDTLALEDILDVPAVREIMENLFRLTGITSALLDLKGQVLVGLGFQDICAHYHRTHPEACQNCTESDTVLASQVEPGTFKLYKCKNNLWDLAAPIHVNGRHVGNLFIGQFFFEEEVPDVRIFKAQAKRFGFDEAEYLAALERVPRVSRSTVNDLGQFYARFSAMISNLSYSSIRFAKMLSERELAEAEKARLQVQLQQSQKLESLGTLAGGVAHDMNNVLGAILGLASAHLGAQPQGSPLHQALDTICKATERGGKMVKGLLSFARQSPAENHKIDLNALLKEQAGLLARTTLAKVCLKLELDPELHLIRGDANALTHTFMNLCVNAVDAMPEEGTLTLRTRNGDKDWVEVEVEDDGVGMTREVLEKAMDPFYTTKEPGKGTGLGLSMAFTTVKAHRGTLAIHSEPGRGTRISLRFPACREEVPAETQDDIQAQPPAHRSLKVLLVDDDELIQSSLQLTLEVIGHSAVTTAQSGEEALNLLEGGLSPDVIILDMNMPGLGGAGTLPRLRALSPEVPVILSTGRSDQTALSLVSMYPGVTLLAKPFGLQDLQTHLGSIGLVEVPASEADPLQPGLAKLLPPPRSSEAVPSTSPRFGLMGPG